MYSIPFVFINNSKKTVRYLNESECDKNLWNFMYDDQFKMFGVSREYNNCSLNMINDLLKITKKISDGVLVKPMKVYISENKDCESDKMLILITYYNNFGWMNSIVKTIYKHEYSKLQWKWLINLSKSEKKTVDIKQWFLEKINDMENENDIITNENMHFMHICL